MKLLNIRGLLPKPLNNKIATLWHLQEEGAGYPFGFDLSQPPVVKIKCFRCKKDGQQIYHKYEQANK